MGNFEFLTAVPHIRSYRVLQASKSAEVLPLGCALQLFGSSRHSDDSIYLLYFVLRKSRDNYSSMAIHDAALSGDEVVVTLLLRRGANDIVRDYLGNTVLHEAVRSRDENLMKLVLDGHVVTALLSCTRHPNSTTSA
jgi:ankyrin repeat protein